MEGVTVLNVITHAVTTWGITAGSIVLWTSGAIAIAIIIAIAIAIKDASPVPIIIMPIVLFGSLGLIAGEDSKEIGTYETYEVTVEDSVNFNEFLGRYEIVDQRGQIYEVKLRDEG